MLGKSLIKGFDKARLGYLLVFLFVALAIPTATLIWQAYSQLKWEAFHQYRGIAEELTSRIDSGLSEQLKAAEARSFADYAFLTVAGDPSARFVQRSPLSEFPVKQDIPGVIGYFQVGTEGEFSTPLLPQNDSDSATFGISAEELDERILVAQGIQTILSDNRLVRRPPAGMIRGIASMPASVAAAPVSAGEEGDGFESRQGRRSENAAIITSQAAGDKDRVDALSAMPGAQPPKQNEVYSQAVFDELNRPKKTPEGKGITGGSAGEVLEGALASKERSNTLGKVADLKLGAAYQKKSEVAELSRQEARFRDDERLDVPSRNKRKERIALPEAESPAEASAARRPAANLGGLADLRISTFESEIDPLEFSLLDSGHFVLFRKVWREGQRYIQGILINQKDFVHRAIGTLFDETGLAAMSRLIVAYQDDVIETRIGNRYPGYTSEALNGELLYRSRLSAPFDSLELIYSIDGLPPGPGARVLAWVTLVLAIVFLGGFYTLYRLGLSQINLARQQQDFVSAVSHELKTPLTSIRMYGEMLKEGWAEPAKRQQYYEYIHDESERLTRLISNVLQLAKITRNEPQFDLKPVTAGELMNQVESKISSQVQRAGFELSFDRDPRADTATIDIDEDCFAQIIINLVDNAIKFSKASRVKLIEISNKLGNDGTVVFSVRDFGPGVPKDQMKKIFKLFYRSETELTRETVGTGIGLAIVHQLSQVMHGKVDVINRGPGAEFRIAFPTT